MVFMLVTASVVTGMTGMPLPWTGMEECSPEVVYDMLLLAEHEVVLWRLEAFDDRMLLPTPLPDCAMLEPEVDSDPDPDTELALDGF